MEDDSLLDLGSGSPTVTDTSKPKTTGNKSKTTGYPTQQDDANREESLRQELANVKKVNEAIEGVLASLQKAKANMTTVNQTVGAASSLLNTWTRILSQAEHNQRLILDPSWQGASQDIADMEEEVAAKQQATERREQEEQERKAAAVRKQEEDERRRAELIAKQSKTVPRGRGRGISRGASASTPASASASANTSMSSIARGSSSHRRTTSNVGRGSAARGRGKG